MEKQIKTYHSTVRGVLLLLFLLFSFAPCSTKAASLHIVGSDYEKPLNPTKSTIANPSCAISIDTSVDQAVKVSSSDDLGLPLHHTTTTTQFTGTHSPVKAIIQAPFLNNLLPPKYILFKRLKISIA